jgi:hypothetical protein
MQSFIQFITESIRQGLPHITSMDHGQFSSLIKGGKVHIHEVTEKTDGMTHKFGYDEGGFYTQSSGSGSEKMRNPEDYATRAKRRSAETGKPFDPTSSKAFGHIHSILHKNTALQTHLKNQYEKTGKEVQVRGEAFYKPLSSPSEHKGEIKFVATSYDPSHMGSVGKYVVHTKLPENADHNVDHFKKHFSSSEMNFDDDKIAHKAAHVDVSNEHKEFKKLDHDLINSRTTKTNKDAKLSEIEKMRTIQKKVSDKVDAHVKKSNISPKWGSGTEGLVVHPSSANPEAPRFKVTSDAFRSYKASGVDFKAGRNA